MFVQIFEEISHDEKFIKFIKGFKKFKNIEIEQWDLFKHYENFMNFIQTLDDKEFIIKLMIEMKLPEILIWSFLRLTKY